MCSKHQGKRVVGVDLNSPTPCGVDAGSVCEANTLLQIVADMWMSRVQEHDPKWAGAVDPNSPT